MLGIHIHFVLLVFTLPLMGLCVSMLHPLDDSSMSTAEQVSHKTSQAISHCKSCSMQERSNIVSYRINVLYIQAGVSV